MLVGGLLTDLFSVESHMRIEEGETKSYSEEYDAKELAVIDFSNPKFDHVTAIAADSLKEGRLISHESIPFRIMVKEAHRNSRVKPIDQSNAGAKPSASQGIGNRVTLSGLPLNTKPGEGNMMSVVIEIIPGPEAGFTAKSSLGTWLVSDGLTTIQTFSAAGKTWNIALRPKRHYKTFSLTLHDFVHERYPGTQIPKNFSSRVTLSDQNNSTLLFG